MTISLLKLGTGSALRDAVRASRCLKNNPGDRKNVVHFRLEVELPRFNFSEYFFEIAPESGYINLLARLLSISSSSSSPTTFHRILQWATPNLPTMNIYNIFTTLIVVLAHLLHTNDHRTLAPLLKAPEPDTTYSICYIITPPATPLTIDPSPPVLAPPFDPDHAPIPPYTHMGATSAGHGTNSFSVNWLVNLLVVIVSGLLVHVSTSYFPKISLHSLTAPRTPGGDRLVHFIRRWVNQRYPLNGSRR